MKLLIITNYLGNKGGLGRYSNEVVKALQKFPIEIKVITEAKNQVTLSEDNILESVFNCSKFRLITNLVRNIFLTRKIARKYDVVHSHDGWPYGLYGYFAVLGTKKKLFITGIGTYTVNPLKKKIIGYLMKKVYGRAQRIFCISNYVKNEIDNICANLRTSVVHMGTTKLPEVDHVNITEYRHKYGIELKKNYPIFLTVGDIKARKGQLDTLKSLNIIKKYYPDFLYVIIGNDDDVYYVNKIKEFALESGISNNVKIISNVYDDLILSFFYSICDLFILNSNNEAGHFEGFGLVLLEAAQFGKPVIGSSGCGIEDALSDRYNGFLTRQGDHDDISNKIMSVFNSCYPSFSKNSKKFYERFSWQDTVNQYYENYLK